MRLRPTKREGRGLLRILVFAVMLALAVSIAFGWITASSGGVALVVALLAVLALILTRDDIRRLLSRVQTVSGLGVSVGFTADHEQAAQDVRDAEADEEPVEIIELRLRLEDKLVYIGQHLLPERYSQFSTIGSLRTQELLTNPQARTAARVLTFSTLDLKALPAADYAEFLKDANIVVGNIRGIVFSGVVRQTVERAGWDVEPIPRPGRLPDYLATKDGRRVRVAPAFSDQEKSAILERAKIRVRANEPQVDRRMIVVPNVSPHETRLDTEPPVVKFRDLVPVLTEGRHVERPPAQRAANGSTA